MLVRNTIIAIAIATLSLVANGQDFNTGSHKFTEVAEGIYAVEPVFAGANGALIINDSGVIVIDSHSTPASSATLIDAVKQLTNKPVRYVINTHWHVDHHSGNEAYAKAYGSRIDFIAQEHTREDISTLGREQFEQTAPYRANPLESAKDQMNSGLDDEGNLLNERQLLDVKLFHGAHESFLAKADEFEFTLPNLTIDHSLTLHGNPYTVQVKYLYPAHTRGDVVVYIPEKKVLIMGDILTKPILWAWSSFPRDYVRTLTELEKLDVNKILIGHGGPVLKGKSYLTTVRELMETMVDFVDQANTEGLNVDETILRSAQNTAIQHFRHQFVADNDQENKMFDQMIGWIIDRAFLELVH
jgi:cyclase